MNKTDYYDLYITYNLPLAEAFCLAQYNYFIYEDSDVLTACDALREKILEGAAESIPKDTEGEDIVRTYMNTAGYTDYQIPGIYQPICDFYGHYNKPETERLRNCVDYLQLYMKGQVTLAEAYVLAKNKNFLLYDHDMLPMLYSIEDLIFEEIIESGEFKDAEADIADYQRSVPRKQICGYNTSAITWLMRIYMDKHHYTYDCTAANSFRPMKDTSGV